MKLESIFSDDNEVVFYDSLSRRYFIAPLRFVLRLLAIYNLRLNDFYMMVGMPIVDEACGDKNVRLKCECCLDTLPGEKKRIVLYLYYHR